MRTKNACRHLLGCGSRAKSRKSTEEVPTNQCKFGEARRLATVARPDICARPAQLAARVNPPQGSDIYQINDSIKTDEERRETTKPEYASSPYSSVLAPGGADGEMHTTG